MTSWLIKSEWKEKDIEIHKFPADMVDAYDNNNLYPKVFSATMFGVMSAFAVGGGVTAQVLGAGDALSMAFGMASGCVGTPALFLKAYEVLNSDAKEYDGKDVYGKDMTMTKLPVPKILPSLHKNNIPSVPQ